MRLRPSSGRRTHGVAATFMARVRSSRERIGLPSPGAMMNFKNLRWISFFVAARFIAQGGAVGHTLRRDVPPAPRRDKSRGYAEYISSLFC